MKFVELLGQGYGYEHHSSISLMSLYHIRKHVMKGVGGNSGSEWLMSLHTTNKKARDLVDATIVVDTVQHDMIYDLI